MAVPKRTGGGKGTAAGQKNVKKGDAEKDKALPPIPGADPAINALRKLGVAVRSSADAAEIRGWLTTGNLAANWAISGRFCRGYPLGRSVEIFGDPSTGKSFFIQWALAAAQAHGGYAYIDDSEHAFNNAWARNALGVRDTALAYQDPPSHTVDIHLSNVKAILGAFLQLGVMAPCVAALDSLGHLSTTAEIDKPDVRDLKRAQDIHKLHRVVSHPLSLVPCVYLIASHKIASLDQWKPSDSSGGKGTKYAATVRLDFTLKGKIKDKTDEIVGVISELHVIKNRLVPPWRKVQFVIPFNGPAKAHSGLLPLILRLGFISVNDGHRIVYRGADTGIHFYGSDVMRQDNSALEFLQRYPTFLAEADQFFDQTEVVYDPEENALQGSAVEEASV
jgi:recombination protein RecA